MVANKSLHPNPSPDSASLVKRLAGPSLTKAGLATDQTEINRIIAEASKGSKFYENEKRKDKDLTERIAKILRIKDEAMRGVDTAKIEAEVDNLVHRSLTPFRPTLNKGLDPKLAELESQRDLTQFIVHVDMDAFYASVELMLNPDLAGKPFAVGRGVLTTASYEARKYGVRSGMAGFVAKKLCPDLIFVSNNFSKYSEMSDRVVNIFKRYDPQMLVAGCDEGYLNITPYCQEHNTSPDDCVQELRAAVQSETQLTVSAGIAPNKTLAKICSDKNKPNGQYHLPFNRQAILEFMRELSIRKLPGVGKVNERLLESIGIKTCGDIYAQRATISLMDKYFGLKYLLCAYLGTGSNVVQPHEREERKSIGAERTFHPIESEQKILQKLEEVAAELEADMEGNGWAGKTITIKYKLHTYQVFTRAKSFNRWITKKEDLFNTGKDLIKGEFPLNLRLIGLRVTKLKDLRESSNQGIKRFFESGAHSSKKKLKLSHDVHHPIMSLHEDDAMPGFLEHEQWESELVEATADDSDDLEQIRTEHSFSRGKPISVSNQPTSMSAITSKPVSMDRAHLHPGPSVISQLSKDVLMCPICSKELETDNTGLNEHIDFCLSKGAIMQATSTLRTVNARQKPEKTTGAFSRRMRD